MFARKRSVIAGRPREGRRPTRKAKAWLDDADAGNRRRQWKLTSNTDALQRIATVLGYLSIEVASGLFLPILQLHDAYPLLPSADCL